MRLDNLNEIRIIVNPGAGAGHQKAAITMMQKLRELGFEGIFDVRYVEVWSVQYEGFTIPNTRVGCVGRALELLIPGFKPVLPDKTDRGQMIDGTSIGIGRLQITRLPKLNDQQYTYNLPKTSLTMTGADDYADPTSPISNKNIDRFWRSPLKYNSQRLVCLQPTNWQGTRCVYLNTQDNPFELPSDAILQSDAQLIVDPEFASPSERKVLELIHNDGCFTQLLYCSESAGGRRKTDTLKIAEQLIAAYNHFLFINSKKPLIILLPRKSKAIKIDVDLTHQNLNDLPKNKAIIVVYTGNVSQAVFDYMLRETSFPPVLEGANGIAHCEANGLPFLHCLDSGEPLEEYAQSVSAEKSLLNWSEYTNKNSYDKIEFVHKNASLCLQNGKEEYRSFLIWYLQDNYDKSDEMLNYHKTRHHEFHQRPDGCELALNLLGIQFGNKNKNVY